MPRFGRGRPAARTGPPSGVWELGAVCRERQAWNRYLCSERDLDARQAYLEDGLDGPV
jgi:hypothetical protein